jgi:hypothetical protein
MPGSPAGWPFTHFHPKENTPMPEQAKRAARKAVAKLTARHTGGIPTDRIPSAEGVRFAFSTLPLPSADRDREDRP